MKNQKLTSLAVKMTISNNYDIFSKKAMRFGR